MNENYTVRYGLPEISKYQHDIGRKVWPEFMQHDSMVNRCWDHLYREFIQYQFILFQGDEAIAVGNTVPLNWTGQYAELPDTGLDWAMDKSCDDHLKGIPANMLVAVQILVDAFYRGKEISYIMIDAMKKLALANGIYRLALPVRPTRKHEFPEMDMKDYLNMKNETGKYYDPWLRVHHNCGGQIGIICYQSMKISGTIGEWEVWTGKQFDTSGSYIVDGALTPVVIDKDDDSGIYLEPNVWVTYDLGKF